MFSCRVCRRLILSGLLFVFFYFIFLGSRAHLWRVSNLGLEPCPFFFLLYRASSRFVFSYLFCVYFISNGYLSLKVMLCHFISCLIFRIYSCQMSFNCVSWFNCVVNYIMCHEIICSYYLSYFKCVSYFKYFVFNYNSYLKMLFCLKNCLMSCFAIFVYVKHCSFLLIMFRNIYVSYFKCRLCL